MTKGRSQEVEDSQTKSYVEDEVPVEYDGDADDTSLSVAEVINRTCGLNADTQPDPAMVEFETGHALPAAPAPAAGVDVLLGRGRRAKQPTKRFKDGDWTGH